MNIFSKKKKKNSIIRYTCYQAIIGKKFLFVTCILEYMYVKEKKTNGHEIRICEKPS